MSQQHRTDGDTSESDETGSERGRGHAPRIVVGRDNVTAKNITNYRVGGDLHQTTTTYTSPSDTPAKVADGIPYVPAVASAPTPRTRLREVLMSYFSAAEIQGLAFDLGADDLPKFTKGEHVLSLLEYLEHRGRVPELLALIRRRRPDVPLM